MGALHQALFTSMRRHVLVLTDETECLAGSKLGVSRVGLPEVGVEAVLKASMGRDIGEEDGWRCWAGESADPRTVIPVVIVGTVDHADS